MRIEAFLDAWQDRREFGLFPHSAARRQRDSRPRTFAWFWAIYLLPDSFEGRSDEPSPQRIDDSWVLRLERLVPQLAALALHEGAENSAIQVRLAEVF